MSLYEKWLRLWADKPVLDLVDLIDNNPELIQKIDYDFYNIGTISICIGGSSISTMVAGQIYYWCNNKLIRRALTRALVKQQVPSNNKEN